MRGYILDIEERARVNVSFRTVLYTSKYLQLVVMSIPVKGDIGEEVHTLDQFIRVEEGEGESVIDGLTHTLSPGYAVLIPAGARHNVLNTGSVALKLYTVYGPPNHRDGIMHATQMDAMNDTEHFDGKTTEKLLT